MTVIDATTAIGKIRLRTGDWGDLPILPDSVIQSALTDCDENLPRSAQLCAQYILGTLTSGRHSKIGTLEIWGKERYDNYLSFIQMTIVNPFFSNIAPVPYSSSLEFSPILQFQADWNKNFAQGTEAQQLAIYGSISPNIGDLYGPLGTNQGWQHTWPSP